MCIQSGNVMSKLPMQDIWTPNLEPLLETDTRQIPQACSQHSRGNCTSFTLVSTTCHIASVQDLWCSQAGALPASLVGANADLRVLAPNLSQQVKCLRSTELHLNVKCTSWYPLFTLLKCSSAHATWIVWCCCFFVITKEDSLYHIFLLPDFKKFYKCWWSCLYVGREGKGGGGGVGRWEQKLFTMLKLQYDDLRPDRHHSCSTG